ncbi:MAG: hypothetical protein K5694_01950 [Bacilli bacterium]|nr:hypothetical protein [Bacilli bacterium]
MEFEYVFEHKVEYEHCNLKGELKISSLLKMIQEVSSRHVDILDFGKDKTMDKGILWVIAKQHTEIKRMPVYGETIYIRTWPSTTVKFLYPRNYEISDEKGEIIIRCNTLWCLIDKNTRRITFPEQNGVILPPYSNGREINCNVSLMPPALEQTTIFKAQWSRCDLNGHLNNTSYFDMCEDVLPTSFLKEHVAKTIDVTYKKEIILDEEVNVRYGLVDNVYWFDCDKFTIRLGF